MNRSVQAAVFETHAEAILNEGLPYDRCDVGVVTDLQLTPGVAEHDVSEPAHMFKVLRTQVDVVLGSGAAVLNADDALIAEMAELSDGSVVLYSLSADNEQIATHRAAQGRAVFLRGDQIVLAEGHEEQLLGRLQQFAPTRGVTGAERVGSLLAAVGAARALGVTVELIAAGLKTYES